MWTPLWHRTSESVGEKSIHPTRQISCRSAASNFLCRSTLRLKQSIGHREEQLRTTARAQSAPVHRQKQGRRIVAGRRRKGGGSQHLSFLQGFSQSHRFEIYRLRRARAGGRCAHPFA